MDRRGWRHLGLLTVISLSIDALIIYFLVRREYDAWSTGLIFFLLLQAVVIALAIKGAIAASIGYWLGGKTLMSDELLNFLRDQSMPPPTGMVNWDGYLFGLADDPDLPVEKRTAAAARAGMMRGIAQAGMLRAILISAAADNAIQRYREECGARRI